MSKMKYIEPQMDIEMCNTKYALMDLLGSGSATEPGKSAPKRVGDIIE